MTRIVTGRINDPHGQPWAGAEVRFTVKPSTSTLTATYPQDTVTVTTDSAGAFSVELATGILYEVGLANAFVPRGVSTQYPRGSVFTVVVPEGEGPISLEAIRALGNPIPPPEPTVVDAVVAVVESGLPATITATVGPLLPPLITDALVDDPALAALVADVTETTTIAITTDMAATLNARIDTKADTTALAPLTTHTTRTDNPHDVTKAQVGLGNVPNVDARNRATHTGTQGASTISDFASAADARIMAARNVAGGVAGLDSTGHIPVDLLSPVAMTDVFPVASEAAMLALDAQRGDVAVRSDVNRSYMHNGGTAGTIADWTELLTPTDAVLSVNGKTGAVTLDKGDVGLGAVANVAPADLPLSTATASALATKANASSLAAHTGNTANPHNVTAAQTGAYTTGQVDTLLAGKAGAGAAKGVVIHGTDAGAVRPAGYASIEWIGSAEPSNMVNGDTWIATVP